MSCLNAGISRATAELTALAQLCSGPEHINGHLDLLQEVAPAQLPRESSEG